MPLRRIVPTLFLVVVVGIGLFQVRSRLAPRAASTSSPTEAAAIESNPADLLSSAASDPTSSDAATTPAPASFADFATWLRNGPPDQPAARAAWIEQGRQLAAERRLALKELIRRNPQSALAAALPYEDRQRVPAEVAALLETPFSGRYDYDVLTTCALDPRFPAVPLERTLHVDDAVRTVHTWGDLLGVTSKHALPAHGIYVDEVAAVSADPIRVLPATEAQARGLATASGIAAEEAGQIVTFPSAAAVSARRAAVLAAAEGLGPDSFASLGAPDPEGASDDPEADTTADLVAAAATDYTQGTKKVLVIRARFADEASTFEPVSLATAQTSLNTVATYYQRASHGKLTLTATHTSTVTLAKASTGYSRNNFATLLADATAAAAAANSAWAVAGYQQYVVITSSKPPFGYAGRAYVGNPGCHVLSSYTSLRTLGHELGHNFGLNHAAYFRTDSPLPNGRDSLAGGYVPDTTNAEWLEYGHRFSLMAAQSGTDFDNPEIPHFAAYEKDKLGWIAPGAGLTEVTASGTYRLTRLEAAGTSGNRGLVIDRAGTDYSGLARRYWLNYRRSFATGILPQQLPYGLQVDWSQTNLNSYGAIQLDMTPYSRSNSTATYNAATRSGSFWTIDNPDKEDGILRIGRTYSDPAADIHFTPVAAGGSSGAEYLDVRVVLSSTGNRAPTATLSASKVSATTGEAIAFTATGTDPDGDPLYYSWDFDDNLLDPAHLNKASITRSWSTATRTTVRVTVSDGKGGTAAAKVVVTIGSPAATGVVWGRVLWGGRALAGARVYADATRQTWTLPDGTFALAGLTPGSNYTLSVQGETLAVDALTFTPQFTNPVAAIAGTLYGRDFHAVQGRLPGPGEQLTGTILTVSPYEAAAAKGDTIQYDATLWDATTGLVLNATAKWSATLASVSSDGLVTATATSGQATVTAVVANTTGKAILFIGNSPSFPAVSLSAAASTVTEGVSPAAAFTVTRSGDLDEPLTATLALAGSANAGTDYVAPSLTVNFPAQEDTMTVTVPLVDDRVIENNETVQLTVADSDDYAVGAQASASTTIADNDSFAAWSAAAQAARPGQGTPSTDYDSDGLPNLVEYALGLDPMVAKFTLTNGLTPGVPRIEIVGSNLVLTYVRDTLRTDVVCRVETSNDLATWTVVTDTLVATSGTIQQRRASVPLAAAPATAYLRLKVTQQ